MAPGAGASADPFVIVGDRVTIYDVSPAVTVSLDALLDASARLDETQRRDGAAAAWALYDSLSPELRVAVAYDTANVEDAPLYPPDPDDVAADDDEPPVDPPADPVRTVTNQTAANHTTPAPNCFLRYAEDKRQMNGKITRRTKYRFHLTAYWRGCDNSTNHSAEPVSVFYSDIAFGWQCDPPTKEFGPYQAPIIQFLGTGTCGPQADVAGRSFSFGKKQPYIRNVHDWTGHRVQRNGDAG